jgi:hypothetical protein
MLSISNAFEMFKASGSMRFIKNKEVLLSIWDAYANLEKEKIQSDIYHNKGKRVVVSIYDFYTSPLKYSFQLLRRSREVKSALEDAIAEIGEEN